MTWNLPWNGASPFADQTSRMQNWKEVNVWSSTIYSCIFMKVHNISLMFVLNFVLIFNLFTLVIFMMVDKFHHIVDAYVEFCFLKKQFLN